ncbi:MAG: hypothetical protein AMS15_02175 [Planctomycetes bacterium DG_23]|nr:MAG: hypothetical protein AMS15_02175 [Planctomycetes bacterium DG_23]
MELVELGKSGIKVTKLGLGSLPMGPLQANLSPQEAAKIIRRALDWGINFFDTAQGYRTYEHLLAGLGPGSEVVIATKTSAADAKGVDEAVVEALEKLKRDYIDIFHLHAAREGEPFVKRAAALERLVHYKEKGTIGAIGISTHFVKVTRQAAQVPEMDVVFPIINKTGMGIIDGSAEEMAQAIEQAHRAGKGVYIMKVFAGGNLLDDRIGALNYAISLAGVDAFMIGALRPEEVDYNARYFLGEEIPSELAEATAGVTKRLVRIRNCKGCGACVEVCPTGALKINEEEGMVTIDHSKCILCGYCAPVCPQFALRMV